MSISENEYTDFISYLDDDGEKKEAWVKILSVGNIIEFQTKAGNNIILPYQRVLKIKRRDYQ